MTISGGTVTAPDQIRLFYTRADKISDPKLLACYRSVLTLEEARKVDRYLDPKARHLSLVARALLRYLLSEYTGRSPESFAFAMNAHGKPSLDSGPNFNLSHTRGGVVCGLCLNHDIGVDIETLDRRVDPGVADRFFSPREAAWVREKKDDAEIKERFLDIWTLKEAYIKAKGMGLAIPLNSFSFDLAGGGIKICFHDQVENPGGWQFFRWCPEPGKIVASAVNSDCPVDIKTFNCIPFEGIYD